LSKSHAQAVTVAEVSSVKLTRSGASPDVGAALKFATLGRMKKVSFFLLHVQSSKHPIASAEIITTAFHLILICCLPEVKHARAQRNRSFCAHEVKYNLSECAH
jgi:hypothetical protein